MKNKFNQRPFSLLSLGLLLFLNSCGSNNNQNEAKEQVNPTVQENTIKNSSVLLNNQQYNTIWVDQTHVGYADGSQTNPYKTIQKAVDSATFSQNHIRIRAGNYNEMVIVENRLFTESIPLIIIAEDNEKVNISYQGPSDSILSSGMAIVNSSYVVVQNIEITNSLIALNIYGSDHVIIDNLEMHNIGQAGVKIHNTSSYIDIINCYIHDTGIKAGRSGYGEGIYVSTANKAFNEEGRGIWPDNTHRVWIEGCTFERTGNGEAINFKGNTTESVIIRNEIKDISPGTFYQANKGAIEIGAIGALSTGERYATNTERDIWIVDNLIDGVRNGHKNSNNGIRSYAIGVTIINNTIKNTENNGIHLVHGNSFDPLTMYVYNNTFENIDGENIKIQNETIPVYDSNPGEVPFTRQMWHLNLF